MGPSQFERQLARGEQALARDAKRAYIAAAIAVVTLPFAMLWGLAGPMGGWLLAVAAALCAGLLTGVGIAIQQQSQAARLVAQRGSPVPQSGDPPQS